MASVSASQIDMTSVPAGALYSANTAAVAVLGLGTGLATDGTSLNCTVTGNVQADWGASSGLAQILNKPTLAAVATSGSYSDLSSKPTIPTTTSQLTNNSGYLTSAPVTSVNGQTGAVTIAVPSTPSFAQGVTHSFVSTTASTGFQVSSTRNALVHYTVTVGTTATIGGASAGLVYFEIAATNSTTPSDWTVVSQTGNSQTITLAVALQSVQTTTTNLAGMVPLGYYARLRTSNVSGTPTFTYVTGQEVLL